MPNPVRKLPDHLVDQIAAGEVVERAASVVKELVENSLDAGAKHISIETWGGGLDRIVVDDDGSGMTASDAEAALERHATSKIERFEDLSHLSTMGFRGEALPSIASVSSFRLRTRTTDAVGGVELRLEPGRPLETRTMGGAVGTTVTVEELFANVPVRRKFLRAAAAETARIGDAITQLALANPGVQFTWVRDGQRARTWPAARDLYERSRQLFPNEGLVAMEGERDGVRVRAALSPPERSRNGAVALYLSVNGRVVRDRALARSVAFAYGSTLPPGRYPVGFVAVSLAPERVDANVHPQKTEVRFDDPREVLDAISRTLASGLGSPTRGDANPNPNGSPAPEPLGPSHPVPTSYAPVQETLHVVRDAPSSASLRVLGQVQRMFLVCEGPEGLVVLDQHAADERVRYDRLHRAYHERAIPSQRWLVPERVDLSEREAVLLEEHAAALHELGLEARLLGARSAVVLSTPSLLRTHAPGRLLTSLLGELGKTGARAFSDAVETLLATMACHGSVRAGDELSPREQEALVSALAAVEHFGTHCPHGRPVAHSITFAELARGVGR